MPSGDQEAPIAGPTCPLYVMVAVLTIGTAGVGVGFGVGVLVAFVAGDPQAASPIIHRKSGIKKRDWRNRRLN